MDTDVLRRPGVFDFLEADVMEQGLIAGVIGIVLGALAHWAYSGLRATMRLHALRRRFDDPKTSDAEAIDILKRHGG